MPKLPNLKTTRERAMLTQAELAAASGVTQASISRIERGQSAQFVTVRALAAALSVAPTELIAAPPTPAAPTPRREAAS